MNQLINKKRSDGDYAPNISGHLGWCMTRFGDCDYDRLDMIKV